MNKKLLAIILAAGISLTSLVGCTGDINRIKELEDENKRLEDLLADYQTPSNDDIVISEQPTEEIIEETEKPTEETINNSNKKLEFDTELKSVLYSRYDSFEKPVLYGDNSILEVQKGEKFGIVNLSNGLETGAKYDRTFTPNDYGSAVIVEYRINSKYGFVNLNTGLETGAKYDKTFTPKIYGDTVAVEVRSNAKYGLINLSNMEELLKTEFSSIEVHENELIVATRADGTREVIAISELFNSSVIDTKYSKSLKIN